MNERTTSVDVFVGSCCGIGFMIGDFVVNGRGEIVLGAGCESLSPLRRISMYLSNSLWVIPFAASC